jgi:hypothetical protein
LTECLTKITVENDCETPRVLKNIQLQITHPVHGGIASLHAIRIIRDNCRGRFLEVMDDESDTVICWPSPVGRIEKEQWAALQARQVAFFGKYTVEKPISSDEL